MKKSLVVLSVIVIVFGACNSKKTDNTKDKYEQTKETLEETERKNPSRFITVEGHDKRNLIGQTVIKGTLTNTAKVCTYTDIDVELSFFSKTKALLEKDHEVIYETLAPGSEASFKTKYFAPKGTDSVALRILGAKTDK